MVSIINSNYFNNTRSVSLPSTLPTYFRQSYNPATQLFTGSIFSSPNGFSHLSHQYQNFSYPQPQLTYPVTFASISNIQQPYQHSPFTSPNSFNYLPTNQYPSPSQYFPIMSFKNIVKEDAENLYKHFLAGNITIQNSSLASFCYSRHLQDLTPSLRHNDPILSGLAPFLPHSKSYDNNLILYNGYNFGAAKIPTSSFENGSIVRIIENGNSEHILYV